MHKQVTEEVIQKVKKYMEICTDSLVSREVLTRTTGPLLDIGTCLLPGRTTKVCSSSCERGKPAKWALFFTDSKLSQMLYILGLTGIGGKAALLQFSGRLERKNSESLERKQSQSLEPSY